MFAFVSWKKMTDACNFLDLSSRCWSLVGLCTAMELTLCDTSLVVLLVISGMFA